MSAPPGPPPNLPLDDRPSLAPSLLATVWTLTALATTFLGLRLYCKFSYAGKIWWDDAILTASYITLLITTILTTHLTTLGLGLPTARFPPQNFPLFLLPVAVRGTFSITSLAWSKTAFGVTLLRLCMGKLYYTVWVIIITVNIALGLSAFLPWVQCKPVEGFWRADVVDKQCWPDQVLYGYNVFSGAYSGAMDFVLALLPWQILMGLQMRKREKVGVAVAMSLGVLAGAAAVVKTVMLKKLYGGELYDTVQLMVWDTAEASITIIATSIPVLKVLFRHVKSKVTKGSRGTGFASRGYELSSNVRAPPRNGSEKSMLDVTAVEDRAILRTDTFAVVEHGRDDEDVELGRTPFRHR